MSRKRNDIGARYQHETKYSREATACGRSSAPEPYEPFKEYPDAAQTVQLPAVSAAPPADFWAVLEQRRSRRDFSPRPLSLDDTARLIFAAQGVTARCSGYLFRTAPSAGALYPVETYLMANRVDGLQSGIYHLNICAAALELVCSGDFSAPLTAAALGQEMVSRAPATFVWTVIPARSTWKYRERGYRYMYMDAGHIAQNLYLAATALGMGCCTIGAFFDEEVNSLLGIDGERETAVYMGVVGKTLEG